MTTRIYLSWYEDSVSLLFMERCGVLRSVSSAWQMGRVSCSITSNSQGCCKHWVNMCKVLVCTNKSVSSFFMWFWLRWLWIIMTERNINKASLYHFLISLKIFCPFSFSQQQVSWNYISCHSGRMISDSSFIFFPPQIILIMQLKFWFCFFSFLIIFYNTYLYFQLILIFFLSADVTLLWWSASVSKRHYFFTFISTGF